MTECLEATLRLIRTPQVGPITYWQLIQRFKTPEAALENLPLLARRGGRKEPFRLFPAEDAQKEIEQHHTIGARLVGHWMPEYPPLLKHLEDAPPVLSVKGHLDFLTHDLHKPIFSVVGTRNASLNALQYTQHLAQKLGEAGWVVASGLARGIDARAHQGSLETGTIAVLAGGIDVLYPPEHQELYHHISEKGALIAEMPFGTAPHPQLFARRNRLISGISWGVAVIEAALRSGSLITARYALEQGREVFALPGFPLDPRCQGSNRLIKQGAHLLETVQDILDTFETSTPLVREQSVSYHQDLTHHTLENLTHERETLFNLIGSSPSEIDELMRHMGCAPGIVLGLLLELELAGRIQRLSAQRVVRVSMEPL